LPSITGGLANSVNLTGWAFSGGSAVEDFPGFGFAADAEPLVVVVVAGGVETAGGTLFSSEVSTGVAEVKALDWAPAGSTKRKPSTTANTRRVIDLQSLPWWSQDRNNFYIDKDAAGGTGVNPRFEIEVTQTVSLLRRGTTASPNYANQHLG